MGGRGAVYPRNEGTPRHPAHRVSPCFISLLRTKEQRSEIKILNFRSIYFRGGSQPPILKSETPTSGQSSQISVLLPRDFPPLILLSFSLISPSPPLIGETRLLVIYFSLTFNFTPVSTFLLQRSSKFVSSNLILNSNALRSRGDLSIMCERQDRIGCKIIFFSPILRLFIQGIQFLENLYCFLYYNLN